MGCEVERVEEYEALCVASTVSQEAAHAAHPRRGDRVAAPAALAGLGTPLQRPPGTVLAVPGEVTEQVVVLLDGDAAMVKGSEVSALGPGDHFGGHRIRRRVFHDRVVMTTEPSQLSVISRPEFNSLIHAEPDLARRLVEDDAEQ